MIKKTIGVLHPGAMGVTLAATLKNAGHDVLWISERRSAATRTRAGQIGLRDVSFITAVCQQAEVIVSVCPPAAAEEVARSVASRKFSGLFIDANAIAPEQPRPVWLGNLAPHTGRRRGRDPPAEGIRRARMVHLGRR